MLVQFNTNSARISAHQLMGHKRGQKASRSKMTYEQFENKLIKENQVVAYIAEALKTFEYERSLVK